MVETDPRIYVVSQIVTIDRSCWEKGSFVASYESWSSVQPNYTICCGLNLKVNPRIPSCMNINKDVVRIGDVYIGVVVGEVP